LYHNPLPRPEYALDAVDRIAAWLAEQWGGGTGPHGLPVVVGGAYCRYADLRRRMSPARCFASAAIRSPEQGTIIAASGCRVFSRYSLSDLKHRAALRRQLPDSVHWRPQGRRDPANDPSAAYAACRR
jgi:hypothetical protein